MSAVAAPASTPDTSDPKPRYPRPRKEFGSHVAGAVGRLQREYRDKNAGAVAIMARLRAAASQVPGGDYEILQRTRVPDRFLGQHPGDDPTDTEQAKHTALTLYALHQQSIYDQPMHIEGPGFGTAISQLSRASKSAEAVRRRFAALGTASSYDAATYHLRSLVRLLRDSRIALDYGLLADDLLAMRKPGGQTWVRAQWGRDFNRALPDPDDNPQDTDSTATPTLSDSEE